MELRPPIPRRSLQFLPGPRRVIGGMSPDHHSHHAESLRRQPWPDVRRCYDLPILSPASSTELDDDDVGSTLLKSEARWEKRQEPSHSITALIAPASTTAGGCLTIRLPPTL